MIKISADPVVLHALTLAFPKPKAAAQRALDKYIAVLEQMLHAAIQHGQTPEQRKFDLYSISLQQLANKGGQIGPDKIRLHKWLSDNNLSLVEKVVTGSKFTKQNSQVKLSALASLQTVSTDVAQSVSHADSDAALEAALLGNQQSRLALFRFLFPEFTTQWRADKLAEIFDLVPVDKESLKAFALWLTDGASLLSTSQRTHLAQQAMTILSIADVNNGYFVQRKNPSAFGRMYYDGLSVQSVHKQLRRAMLGNCWEYDIRSSVVAWKMGFARNLLIDMGIRPDVKAYFPMSLLYLEDKADFMGTVRYFTFQEDSAVPKDFQLPLLKQAFTAISFGARAAGKGWTDGSGNWVNPALVDILRNAAERERFLSDEVVKGFIAEQKMLDQYIFEKFMQSYPDLAKLTILQTESGRVSKAKLLAYLYQHDETSTMDIVRRVAAEHGHRPIANVHDAIFFKKRLGADLKHHIELTLREQTGNPYWHLAPKRLERFTPRSLDEERQQREHTDWIKHEESLARSRVTGAGTAKD
ncbi:MAG: hypothetical protein RI906_716 [Pseudomonadota bacterium]|jgi:hypothetical protein